MELNVNWDEYKEKINRADLERDLSEALIACVDEFAALPLRPNTINPHYMAVSLWGLGNDITAEEPPEVLWWEMYIDLAEKWAEDRGDMGTKTLKAIADLRPKLAIHFDNDDSQVTLEEINGNTVHNILLLSETLSETKKYYVAPNAVSLSQAHFNDKAWFRAIYAGKMPIGFVMLYLDEEKPEYFVWRLMIGEPFHGRGYGRKAMEAIKAHVRTLPNAKSLLLSYGQGPGSPEGFYKKLGFDPTGEIEGGEVYAKIEL